MIFVHAFFYNGGMFSRNLAPEIEIAFRDTPVVFLNGARQTGKSTLARELFVEGKRPQYLTLEDAPVLSAARADPSGFVAGLDGPVVLDEVQRAPDLFLAIKPPSIARESPAPFCSPARPILCCYPRWPTR